MPALSVIIPAYNEEAGLADVLQRVHAVLQGVRPYEIIVVDDGSTDATGTIAGQAGVTVITNPVNMGYGFSLKRGIRAATAECLVITDADGTYPFDKIPELLAEYERGFDMVVGARQGREYYSSLTKRLARYWFTWLSEFVVGKKIPDINSGLRVIRRSKILPHLPELANAFSFTTSTTLIFFLQQYFVSYRPVTYQARQGKTKVRYIRDALRTLQIMVEIIAAYNPVKLFLLLAALPALVAVGVVIFALVRQQAWYLIGVAPPLALAFLLLALGWFASIFKTNDRASRP